MKASRPEGYNQMRLKLVLTSSLIAAVVGTGSAIAIIISVFSSLKPITAPGLLVVSTYLLPMLATLLASIFVYRHTARRRKLQAILTAIVTLLLTILFFVVASIVTARREPLQPGPGSPTNVSKS
jgi:amino acid transporter